MKRLIACLMICGYVFADAPAPYPITINSRAQNAPPVLVYRANGITFRASFTDGDTPSVLSSNDTPYMVWATSSLASSVATSTYSVVSLSTGIVDFAFSPAGVNYAAGRYIYEIGVKDSNDVARTYRQGIFTIQGSPTGTGAGPVTWTSNINWNVYQYTGTATYGPYRAGTNVIFSANTDGSQNINVHTTSGATTVTAGTDIDVTTNVHDYTVSLGSTVSATIASALQNGDSNTNLVNDAGYLTSYAEVDPVWSAVSNTVTAGAALGATAVQTEVDPIYAASSNAILSGVATANQTATNVFLKSDASYALGNKNLSGVQDLTVSGNATVTSNLTVGADVAMADTLTGGEWLYVVGGLDTGGYYWYDKDTEIWTSTAYPGMTIKKELVSAPPPDYLDQVYAWSFDFFGCLFYATNTAVPPYDNLVWEVGASGTGPSPVVSKAEGYYLGTTNIVFRPPVEMSGNLTVSGSTFVQPATQTNEAVQLYQMQAADTAVSNAAAIKSAANIFTETNTFPAIIVGGDLITGTDSSLLELSDMSAAATNEINKGVTAYGWGDHSAVSNAFISADTVVSNALVSQIATATNSLPAFARRDQTNTFSQAQTFSGNVGIGTASPSYPLDVNVSGSQVAAVFTGTGTNYTRIAVRTDAGTDAEISFLDGASSRWSLGNDGSNSNLTIRTGTGLFGTAADRLAIDQAGNVYLPDVYDATVTSSRDLEIQSDGKIGYVSSSIDYKENVKDTSEADYLKLLSLRPRVYDRVDGSVQGEWGLVAEEVDALNLPIPNLVSYKRIETAATDENGVEVVEFVEDKQKPETVNYSRLIPFLLDGLKRQQAEIDAIKGRLDKLEQ
jgi:hypothetical protein